MTEHRYFNNQLTKSTLFGCKGVNLSLQFCKPIVNLFSSYGIDNQIVKRKSVNFTLFSDISFFLHNFTPKTDSIYYIFYLYILLYYIGENFDIFIPEIVNFTFL